MKESRHPSKTLYRSQLNVDETIVSNEASEEEYYHMVTGANRQLGG